MLDFDRWFSRQGAAHSTAQKPTQQREIPEGIDEMKGGQLVGSCCRCEREIEIDPEWLDDERLDPLNLYCYGSPGCCP